MGAYKDAMRRAYNAEFSRDMQPKVEMPIVSNIERVQPYVVGTKPNGEFVWEGRPMPKWQMELLRFMPDMFTEFFTRWIEKKNHELKDEEFRPQDNGTWKIRTATKERISEMRRNAPAPKGYARKVKGD